MNDDPVPRSVGPSAAAGRAATPEPTITATAVAASTRDLLTRSLVAMPGRSAEPARHVVECAGIIRVGEQLVRRAGLHDAARLSQFLDEKERALMRNSGRLLHVVGD